MDPGYVTLLVVVATVVALHFRLRRIEELLGPEDPVVVTGFDYEHGVEETEEM